MGDGYNEIVSIRSRSINANKFAIIFVIFSSLTLTACAGNSTLSSTLEPTESMDAALDSLPTTIPALASESSQAPDLVNAQTQAGISHPNTEFPLMPDAQNAAAFGDLFTYESASPLQVVVDFYKVGLATESWLLDEEISVGETVILIFTLGERRISIAISPDVSDAEILSIVIAEEE